MTSVIAEIGSNHCGSVDIAMSLIDMAADAGAHAVKFQKRDNTSLYTKAAYKSPYNSENAYGQTYGEHREALEFGIDEYRELKASAEDKGLLFFATAFDEPSVDFLAELGCQAVKLASGSAKDIPLIRYAKASGMRLVISTGGCTLEDVDRIVEVAGPECFTLLACTASYPCSFDELQLGSIPQFIERYPGVTVGASMHDNGIAMAVAAAALGAKVIEKHVTLDRTMKGTDHAFSLEPQGLAKLVRDLKRLDAAMDRKQVYESEREPIIKMSRSVVAARDLSACHVLTADDVKLCSPGGGIPPYELERLRGRILVRPLVEDEMLDWRDVD